MSRSQLVKEEVWNVQIFQGEHLLKRSAKGQGSCGRRNEPKETSKDQITQVLERKGFIIFSVTITWGTLKQTNHRCLSPISDQLNQNLWE